MSAAIKRRARVEVQRGRGVDPDFVKVERIQRLLQLVDLVARFELGLQLFKRGVGRQHKEVREGRGVDEVLGCLLPKLEVEHLVEELGHRVFQCICSRAEQVARRVGLGIEIDHQGACAARGGDGGQVAGNGALADTTLLIEDNAFHGDFTLWKDDAIFAQ